MYIMEDNCSHTDPDACSSEFEYIVYLYVHAPICIAGICLNILNLLVLSRKEYKLHPSTCTLLFGLAWLDLLTLLSATPLGFVRCLPFKHDWEQYVFNLLENYIVLPFINTFATASVWLTVVLSIERYLFVKHSHAARKLCANAAVTPRAFIVGVSVGALAINFPFFFDKTLDEDGNIVSSEFGQSAGYHGFVWLRLVLCKLLPIVAATCFNLLLVVGVSVARMKHKNNPGARATFAGSLRYRRQRQQLKLSTMMIGVSSVFIICHILEPFLPATIYSSLFGHCALHRAPYKIMRLVTNVAEQFSFASNFVFYCAFNKRFRLALRQLLCYCSTRQEKTVSSPDPGVSLVVKPNGHSNQLELRDATPYSLNKIHPADASP